MEKVKVTRYMRGQRPEFAPDSSSEEEEEEEVTTGFQGRVKPTQVLEERQEDVEEEEAQAVQDRRLRRLQQRQMPESDDDDDDRYIYDIINIMDIPINFVISLCLCSFF